MLTIADEGGGEVQEPLILADVIWEQPLMKNINTDNDDDRKSPLGLFVFQQ